MQPGRVAAALVAEGVVLALAVHIGIVEVDLWGEGEQPVGEEGGLVKRGQASDASHLSIYHIPCPYPHVRLFVDDAAPQRQRLQVVRRAGPKGYPPNQPRRLVEALPRTIGRLAWNCQLARWVGWGQVSCLEVRQGGDNGDDEDEPYEQAWQHIDLITPVGTLQRLLPMISWVTCFGLLSETDCCLGGV